MRCPIFNCRRWTFVLLALVTALGSAAHASIQNGSFETYGAAGSGGSGLRIYAVTNADPTNTNITDWTVAQYPYPPSPDKSGQDVYLHITPDAGIYLNSSFNFAQQGNSYLDLSGGFGGGQFGNHANIYQDVTTVANVVYNLSFYIGAAHDPGSTDYINVNLFDTANNTVLLDKQLTPNAPADLPGDPNEPNIDWKFVSYTFTATSTTTRLTFHDLSTFDDNRAFVDNVSLEPADAVVPESSALTTFALLIGISTIYVRYGSGKWQMLGRLG